MQPNQNQLIRQAADAMSLSLLFSLGRQYLDVPFSEAGYWQLPTEERPPAEPPHFLRVEQVGEVTGPALLTLQTALTACYDPRRYSLLFAMANDGHQERVYLGVRGRTPAAQPYAFLDYLADFVQGNWPGSRLHRCEAQEIGRYLQRPLSRQLKHATALTGIPSRLPIDTASYPTSLSRLQRGLKQYPYLYLVIANPMPIGQVESIIYNCRELLGRVHSLTKTTLTESLRHEISQAASETESRSEQQTESHYDQQSETRREAHHHSRQENLTAHREAAMEQNRGFGVEASLQNPLAGALGWLAGMFPPAGFLASLAEVMPVDFGVGYNREQRASAASLFDYALNDRTEVSHTRESRTSHTTGHSQSYRQGRSQTHTRQLSQQEALAFGKEYINAHAEAAKAQLQQYVARFEQARAIGCWDVGVYLVADKDDTAQQGGAQLRALLSGYNQFEPVRVHNLARLANRVEMALADFQQVGLTLVNPDDQQPLVHPLGPTFTGLTTPLSTEELALLVNLPPK